MSNLLFRELSLAQQESVFGGYIQPKNNRNRINIANFFNTNFFNINLNLIFLVVVGNGNNINISQFIKSR